jgi:hypothetical protein
MSMATSLSNSARRVADVVREMIPHLRQAPLTPDEATAATFMRGNEPLHAALTRIITTRIQGRASIAEPSDPVVCKSMMARDRELQWVLNRLDFLYHAPVQQDDDERPA